MRPESVGFKGGFRGFEGLGGLFRGLGFLGGLRVLEFWVC